VKHVKEILWQVADPNTGAVENASKNHTTKDAKKTRKKRTRNFQLIIVRYVK
jgi:hypothetical protein